MKGNKDAHKKLEAGIPTMPGTEEKPAQDNRDSNSPWVKT